MRINPISDGTIDPIVIGITSKDAGSARVIAAAGGLGSYP